MKEIQISVFFCLVPLASLTQAVDECQAILSQQCNFKTFV
jgi:hypothetical protein